MHAHLATEIIHSNALYCFHQPELASAPQLRVTWGLVPVARKVSMRYLRRLRNVGRSCALHHGHALNVVAIFRFFALPVGFLAAVPNASQLQYIPDRAGQL